MISHSPNCDCIPIINHIALSALRCVPCRIQSVTIKPSNIRIIMIDNCIGR